MDSDVVEKPLDVNEDGQATSAQSSMNATASMAGGNTFHQTKVSTSLSKSVLNYFKGTTSNFTNIKVATAVQNKNLKMFMTKSRDEEELPPEYSTARLPSGLNNKRGKHQLLVTTLYNKIVMLHLCPATGEIYIHELDPTMSFKYSNSISLARGEVLHQIQVVDNLIVVHNMDQKSTNVYDIKLAEYYLPLCMDNLDVDTSFYEDCYHTDPVFEQDKESHVDEFNEPAEPKIKESKEYFEINYKFNYTGEDDEPVQFKVDIPTDDKVESKEAVVAKSGIKTDVYLDHIIFVDPMFLIDTKKHRTFTLKLSVERMIEKQRNMCR